MNKQIIHDALVLTAFTLVIGVILGAVYGITKAPIDKANEQTKKEAYQAVFADASGFNQQEYDADAAILLLVGISGIYRHLSPAPANYVIIDGKEYTDVHLIREQAMVAFRDVSLSEEEVFATLFDE